MLNIDEIKIPLDTTLDFLVSICTPQQIVEITKILVKYIETTDLREISETRINDLLVEPISQLQLMPVMVAAATKFNLYIDIDKVRERLAGCISATSERVRNDTRFANFQEIKLILSKSHIYFFMIILVLNIELFYEHLASLRIKVQS